MKNGMKKMMGGGYMRPMGMKEGGSMKAGDKMAYGGKVKKMAMGGSCRGGGAAIKGLRFTKNG